MKRLFHCAKLTNLPDRRFVYHRVEDEYIQVTTMIRIFLNFTLPSFLQTNTLKLRNSVSGTNTYSTQLMSPDGTSVLLNQCCNILDYVFAAILK